MKQPLFTRTLTRTAVACTCFVRGIGYCEATLARHHTTGNIVLELPWRNHYITSGETRYSESGVAITELISETGKRYYVQSAAGDVWAAVNEMPRAVMSPEVEAIHQMAS